MDLLTHALGATRARSPLIADLRLGNDVSLGIPHLNGIPFHYVVAGHCRLNVQAKRIELNAGDLVMLPRWPDYRVETGTGLQRAEVMDFAVRRGLPTDYLRSGLERPLLDMVGDGPTLVRLLSGIIALAGPDSGPLIRDLPEMILLHSSKAQLEPWLVAAIEFISAEGVAPEPGFGAVAERLIELIFVATLRRWLLQHGYEKRWMRDVTDPTIFRALDALHAEPARRWTLGDLAIVSGRSRSGFAEHFRAVMEETPFVYLARWRMQLAYASVGQGRLSLAEVGASLGYRSSRAFGHKFLETFGETPMQYRGRVRGK